MPENITQEDIDRGVQEMLAEINGEVATPPADAPVEPEPAPEPAAAVEDQAPEPVPEAPVEKEAKQEPAPETEETDWRARAAELEAKLAEQQAHNSRLAGKSGFLERRLRELAAKQGGEVPADVPSDDEFSRQVDAEAAEAEARYARETAELEERAALEERLARVEEREEQGRAERLAAIDKAAFDDVSESISHVPDEVKEEILRPFGGQLLEAKRAVEALEDEDARRAAARTLAATTATLVQEMFLERRHSEATERRAASIQENLKAKKAATVSGGGATASAPPRRPDPKTMTISEADAWLRAHYE